MDIAFSQPNVEELFTVAYSYRIPRFQRAYAWETRQLDELWADLGGMGPAGHFLGPLVLLDSSDGTKSREVIDGQQRLTTLQMLLAIIRDRYVALGDPPGDDGRKSSVPPNSLVWSAGYEEGFRLRASEVNREVLEDFILRAPDDARRKSLDDKGAVSRLPKALRARNKPLINAYRRLSNQLDKHLAETPDSLTALRQFEKGIVARVRLVILDLKDMDDAYLLFETLNQRGLRLSAADLVKSYLLSQLDKKHGGASVRLKAASDDWDDMVETLGGGDITGFLRHYLLMRHDRVRKEQVFPFFRDDVKKSGPDKALAELTTMGDLYSEFQRPPTGEPALEEVLRNLNGTGVDTHRIALLPARRYLTPEQFLTFAQLTEILSFRWVVTDGNAQVLESMYQEVAAMLHESKGDQLDAALALLEAKLPSDKFFMEKFAEEALGYAYVASYALRRIENAIVPGEKTIKSSSEVHVEHVMPQTATDFWSARVTGGYAYEEIVRRWGNLTLLLKKINVSIKNGDWTTKREGTATYQGYEGSDVQLTRNLLDLPDWTSETIELRAKWLAAVAFRVWSLQPEVHDLPSFPDVFANPALLVPYFPKTAQEGSDEASAELA